MAANFPPAGSASDVLGDSPAALAPSYTLPIGLGLLALPLLLLSPWVSAAIALFGCFLLVQAATLRLTFTPTDLDIYRGDRLIRRFPYQAWENWRIFWRPVPILFYFKEINSIHFLPMLFSATQLREALERHQLPVTGSPND
ncbi:MAG: DUF3119 family protein [Cyanobacteria bacterium P01_A01_bin.135]